MRTEALKYRSQVNYSVIEKLSLAKENATDLKIYNSYVSLVVVTLELKSSFYWLTATRKMN